MNMATALVNRFGTRLHDKLALAELMVMRQNRRNVRDFAADFENCVGKPHVFRREHADANVPLGSRQGSGRKGGFGASKVPTVGY